MKRKFFLFFLFIILAPVFINAKEVTIKHKNLTLNAELELIEGKRFKDGIILITHGSLAHRDMQTLSYLRSVLHEFGYSTLAINLSLGLSNRHGMYDCKIPHKHTFNDAIEEIDQWVAWLQKQGVKNITLLGHSRGGAQTALYAVKRDNKLINAIILIAPATKVKDDTKKLSALIQKAKMIKNSASHLQMLDSVPIMQCKKTKATVTSFLSYNAFTSTQDTPTLLSSIKKPTLVLIGGNDTIVVGLDKKIAPLADGKRIQMKIIETAGHFFRDINMDEAVEVMDEFLQGL